MVNATLIAAFPTVAVPVVNATSTCPPPSPAAIVESSYTRDLIRHKARKLVRASCFTPSDQEDVEQDLTLHLLKRASQYQPTRAALNTFVSRVVDAAAVDVIRRYKRRKRRPATAIRSLDEPLDPTTTATMGSAATESDAKRHLHIQPTSDQSRFETQEAVAQALTLADPKLRQLYTNLEQGTVASVARDLGLSRRQRRALLEASRPAFKKAGFGNSRQ